ncbi:MAG: thermonuclease family protein [Mesorhizobium sp.]|nr:MAG: thermonuclease family protein [Mesorhizobium sp.]
MDAAAEPSAWSGRARVIDGDTISIRQQRIRIAAIDACELDQTGLKDGQTWRCGVIARSYLRKMIDGQHVRCDIIDQDRYRRLVGQCFIGDADVGLAMVNAGNGLGIWSAEIESPHLYRRAKPSKMP